MLFINAEKHFDKGKRQNFLADEHIQKVIDTYQHRAEEDRYSNRVDISKIIEKAKSQHNAYLAELGLPPLP